MTISRRTFIKASAASAVAVAYSGRVRQIFAGQNTTQWHDVTTWGVEGRGWQDQPRTRYFDRFPAKAEGVVPGPVWNLSRHSAGMAATFRTDAKQISVDYELLSGSLGMPHMPPTGVSGIDLYGKLNDGPPRWVQVVKPTKQQMHCTVADGLDGTLREYTMYLPLYNGVNSMKIGVPAGSQFEPIAPRAQQPILFWGTSIMHGACASRPGMALPAILGRWFDRPTINLGFSGNGRMDKPVADLIAELNPAVYCIDCLPNMNPAMVRERTAPMVHILRSAHPETPIVLVEGRVNTNAEFFASRREHHKENHKALRDAYDALLSSGVKNLCYLKGDDLLGRDGEASTDGSHPSDLGFMRYALAYEKVLIPLLGPSRKDIGLPF